MSKRFVNIGLSLDGYMASEGMTMENWDKPEYKNWGAKWGALMRWILNQQYIRENLKLGPGGETGPVNDMIRNTTERIGANIMGKRMFDQGERAWPEEAPFHTPVYVLTHAKREPWIRPGGTTFYFINDGPEHALELARESAGTLYAVTFSRDGHWLASAGRDGTARVCDMRDVARHSSAKEP